MKRILTALVGIPILIGLTWLGGWSFVALMMVITVAGQREVFDMFQGEGHRPGNLLAFLAGMALVAAPAWPPAAWLVAPLVVGSLTWFLVRAPGGQPLNSLGGSMMGLIYPAVFLAALVAIRIPPVEVAWDPFALTLGVMILMWTADTAAYYAGRNLGRHPLAPTLSPKKTWEGVVGGVLGAALAGVVMATWWSGGLEMTSWLVLAAIVSTVGPAGDLFESALKRAAGVKDSSSILPGHGGIMDRFDALIFVAPIVAVYLFRFV